jgi:RNA polymerase sigma-70 factor (ECF subfamily)
MPDLEGIPLELVEADLVQRAKNGDVEAYGQLYERHAPQVFRFLYAHLQNRLDAEDLTGEVFMRAWRSLDGYRERGLPFTAFLFRVARNLVIDQYRRKQFSTLEVELSDDHPDDRLADPAEVAQRLIDQGELQKKLALLREEYRAVLVMRFLSDLSPEETAQAMRKSVGAVRVLQHRALLALRKLIESEQ